MSSSVERSDSSNKEASWNATVKRALQAEEPQTIIDKFDCLLQKTAGGVTDIFHPKFQDLMTELDRVLEGLYRDCLEGCLKPKAFYRRLASMEIEDDLAVAMAAKWALHGQKLIRKAARHLVSSSHLSMGPYMLKRVDTCIGLNLDFDPDGDISQHGIVAHPYVHMNLGFNPDHSPPEEKMLMELSIQDLVQLYDTVEQIQAHLDELRQ